MQTKQSPPTCTTQVAVRTPVLQRSPRHGVLQRLPAAKTPSRAVWRTRRQQHPEPPLAVALAAGLLQDHQLSSLQSTPPRTSPPPPPPPSLPLAAPLNAPANRTSQTQHLLPRTFTPAAHSLPWCSQLALAVLARSAQHGAAASPSATQCTCHVALRVHRPSQLALAPRTLRAIGTGASNPCASPAPPLTACPGALKVLPPRAPPLTACPGA